MNQLYTQEEDIGLRDNERQDLCKLTRLAEHRRIRRVLLRWMWIVRNHDKSI